MRRIHVGTVIRADLDTVWLHTQDPARHQRWDARFGRIEYVAGPGPQRFRYATLAVAGIGTTVGERLRPDGCRTSALRFASGHPLSPIRSGAGYWRYSPVPGGVRFVTGYDYRPGWGSLPDVLIRPVVGWLTAWSFDRLRLWCETGASPERTRARAVAEVLVRLGFVLAAGPLGLLPVVLAGVAALLVPPLPGTPAARRTWRRPRRPVDDTAPHTLDRLALP
jgi:hypothetical protein